MWKCRDICKTTQSLRAGSIFENCNIPLENIVMAAYCWAQGYSHEQTKRESEIGGNTLVKWFKLFREICIKYNAENLTRIGGHDENLKAKVVEISRHPLTETRRSRTNTAKGIKIQKGSKKVGWLFLGVERDSGAFFLFRALDITEVTIKKMFLDFIEPGTRIITDGAWAKNVDISDTGYTLSAFLPQGKKKGFVSADDPTLHTNNCKCVWSSHKRLVLGKRKAHIESLLHKLMFRNRAKIQGHGCFEAFLLAIQVHPVTFLSSLL